ncbi:hypothetical protein PIIN_11119 [Serendipita indica DSM 11827]|uniref:Uncharacterized protein n=1 Tax=Serendipita indica (strain DSM 11827) TaxID=1109443 RepID=G4U0P3_SERID|nr:hypothetical protein PIIN_11119 [Serendipita indica DSM 11827]
MASHLFAHRTVMIIAYRQQLLLLADRVGVPIPNAPILSASRRGSILFSNELVRRYGDKGLIAISVHPGVIRTDLDRNHDSLNRWMYWHLAQPVEYGGLTQLYAANVPEAKELSGKARSFDVFNSF